MDAVKKSKNKFNNSLKEKDACSETEDDNNYKDPNEVTIDKILEGYYLKKL